MAVDQLNTFKSAVVYLFLPPDEARMYLDRFEFHYTPKRGNWLNWGLRRNSLDRRIYQLRLFGRRSLHGETDVIQMIGTFTGNSLPTFPRINYTISI